MQTAFFMRNVLLILLLVVPFAIQAQTPDSLAVTKLYSTSWMLEKQYKMSGRRFRELDSINTERITFYNNEIHWDITGNPYQVCSHRLRNQNEFWIDCKVNDQMIYRVIQISGDQLIIDILIKLPGETEYKRTGRKHYRKAK